MPTTRFNDIASKIFTEIGIKSPVNLFDANPVTTRICEIRNAIITIEYVTNLSRVAYLNLSVIYATSYFLIYFLAKKACWFE